MYFGIPICNEKSIVILYFISSRSTVNNKNGQNVKKRR